MYNVIKIEINNKCNSEIVIAIVCADKNVVRSSYLFRSTSILAVFLY
jgi:hypothetical protein